MPTGYFYQAWEKVRPPNPSASAGLKRLMGSEKPSAWFTKTWKPVWVESEEATSRPCHDLVLAFSFVCVLARSSVGAISARALVLELAYAQASALGLM